MHKLLQAICSSQFFFIIFISCWHIFVFWQNSITQLCQLSGQDLKLTERQILLPSLPTPPLYVLQHKFWSNTIASYSDGIEQMCTHKFSSTSPVSWNRSWEKTPKDCASKLQKPLSRYCDAKTERGEGNHTPQASPPPILNFTQTPGKNYFRCQSSKTQWSLFVSWQGTEVIILETLDWYTNVKEL